MRTCCFAVKVFFFFLLRRYLAGIRIMCVRAFVSAGCMRVSKIYESVSGECALDVSSKILLPIQLVLAS